MTFQMAQNEWRECPAVHRTPKLFISNENRRNIYWPNEKIQLFSFPSLKVLDFQMFSKDAWSHLTDINEYE